MLDFEADLLSDHGAWRQVLETYRRIEEEWSQEASGSAEAEDDSPLDERSWLPRVSGLDGLESEELSRVHGKLIALGWLNFDVAGGQVGMRYRLSVEGARALEAVAAEPEIAAADELTADA